MQKGPKIALVGNPNCGKTSLFNALTGLRQKVGNFPGVTVDRKSGHVTLPDGRESILIDLPGTYSLYPSAEDEKVATSVLANHQDQDHPDLVVLVADATNLRRSLLLCTQVMDLGLPVLLALNMADLLEKEGRSLNAKLLAKQLGITVVVISALKGLGLEQLIAEMGKPHTAAKEAFFKVPASFDTLLLPVTKKIGTASRYLGWLLLMRSENFSWLDSDPILSPDKAHVLDDPDGLINNEMAMRYDRINEIVEAVESNPIHPINRISDRLDRWLLHPIVGYLIFVALLMLIFQSIFAWASIPMDWIDTGFSAAGEGMKAIAPQGWLTDLLVDGAWAGLGGIVIFVPQIAMLFFFISLLEDSGYMSRVVFLMDRIVRPFGFSGKSVIPLIGGMACAVPSVMMARTIPSRTERLITIMVTPLMSCSARIPVYVLLISMFVPEDYLLGVISLQGLVMTAMYFLGFFMALVVAWVIKTVSKYKSDGIFVTELPIYRMPRWRNTLLTMFHKSRTFVLEAGKIIILISMVLWVLKSYGPPSQMAAIDADFDPRITATQDATVLQELENAKASGKLKASYAGMIGQTIEPAIRPLGFDWKIGIALLSSFAAREVFVGTMATLYGAGEAAAEDEESKFEGLRSRMKAEVDPETGKPVYTSAVAFSLLIFYAFAMQCMSTLAVVKKETGSWKMTLAMLAYMTGLAYGASFLVYQFFS
jgi:ferrous iron transport protein B